jgi:hypothetical protein
MRKLLSLNIHLFLGKCSMHFLCGNWNFTFPSFESISTPVTTRKIATRSTPVFATRSACPHAVGTTPLVIVTHSAPAHALRVTYIPVAHVKVRYG